MSLVASYIRCAGRHWWALMSCAIFTLLGLYILLTNQTNRWAVDATFTLAVICLIVAGFLAWRDEYLRAVELEHKYQSEIPKMGLTVISRFGQDVWNEAVATKNVPATFCIQYLSGRIATSVRFDPIPSKLGKFSLRFDALAHVDPPVQKPLSHELWEDGIPPNPKVIESIGKGYDLSLFIADSVEGAKELRYTLTARFKDGDEERTQNFHVIFDTVRFGFLPNTA